MRHIFGLLAFVATLLIAPAATAQPVVVADPLRYATELSNNMAVGGFAPLRQVYVQFAEGAALATNVEAALLSYERVITSPRAVEARIVEDVSLSDTYRAIFLYHYYGSTTWVFTRLDFVNLGGGEWRLVAATFGSQWSNVAIATTPSFRSNMGNRR